MGLSTLLSKDNQRTKAECLQIIGENITDANLNFLADLAQKKGVNKKLESKKALIKTFI